MATFPFSQTPQIANYKESTVPAIIRSETEGIIKQAVRYSANYINYDVTYIFTDTELESWRTFFNTTISRGAISFDWVNPSSSATVDARMIGGSWELSVPSQNVNIVKFTLEVFDSV